MLYAHFTTIWGIVMELISSQSSRTLLLLKSNFWEWKTYVFAPSHDCTILASSPSTPPRPSLSDTPRIFMSNTRLPRVKTFTFNFQSNQISLEKNFSCVRRRPTYFLSHYVSAFLLWAQIFRAICFKKWQGIAH